MKRFLFLLTTTALFSRACPFIQGRWFISEKSLSSIRFQVDDSHITSFVDMGGVMRVKHSILPTNKKDCLVLSLTDPEIIKRPSDWYNLPKYAGNLGLFKRFQKEPSGIELEILDDSCLRVVVRLGDQEFQPFFLMREEERIL